MPTSQLQIYKFLERQYGETDAELLLEHINETITDKMEQKISVMATKEDLLLLKNELLEKIYTVKHELTEKINSLHKSIVIISLAQLLAITGSVLAIIKFMIK